MKALSLRWSIAALMAAGIAMAASLWPIVVKARAERMRSPALTAPRTESHDGGAPRWPAASEDETRWRLTIEIRDDHGALTSGRVYVTDANGELLSARQAEPPAPLTQEVRGLVSVIAYAEGYVPQYLENIAAPEGGDRSVEIALARGRGICGHVVDDLGDPETYARAGSLRIWVRPVDAPRWMYRKSDTWKEQTDTTGRLFTFRSKTEPDGSFHVRGLLPGRYEIECDQPRAYSESTHVVLRPELVVATVGDDNVRIVCQRPVQVRVRYLEVDTGEVLPAGTLSNWRASHSNGREQSGSGGVEAGGLAFEIAPGASFRFSAKVEGYISPEPLLIAANNEPGIQDVGMKFQRDPCGMAELDLVVRDDVGAPVSMLAVAHGEHWQRLCSEDGRFLLRMPAGHQHIVMGSPNGAVLQLRREWTVSADDPERPDRVYVPQDIDIELPRGGRVTRLVTMQRAALIWVRHDPKMGIDARLFRDGIEMQGAFEALHQSMGLVAAVEPGTYRVEASVGEQVVTVPVEAKATEVAEVWVRAEGAK